jgi:hypothetical protein
VSTPLSAALSALTLSDPYARARAEAMLVGYDAMWEDETVEVLSVEREFQFPLPADQEWLVGGKVDLIARVNGRLLIIDHKTSSEDFGHYRSKLQLNGQASHYMLAAEHLGLQPEAFMFDVLAKPTMRPLGVTKTRKQPESPEDYRARCLAAMQDDPEKHFARFTVTRLEADRAAYLRSLQAVTTQIDTISAHRLEIPNPEACHSHHSVCPFHPVCTGTGSLDDTSLYTRAETGHAELSRAIPEGKRLISNSRRALFQQCQVKHAYTSAGWQPLRTSDALSFGTAIHKSLEAYWLARKQ